MPLPPAPYVVDPTDSTRPITTDPAEQAQAELRALKGYIQGIIPIANSGMNFFRKNRILNGSFVIDQRNEGAAVAVGSVTTFGSIAYLADRWVAYKPAGATATCKKGAAIGINSVASGQIITTVGAAPIATDIAGMETATIPEDVVDLQYGTVNALTCSLSFVCESPIAGLHAVAIRNTARTGANRSFVSTFNIPIANTPTNITINGIPGDIAGTWNAGIVGIDLFFDAGSGSNFETATVNAWQAGNFTRTAGCVKPMSIAGTFAITNVQFEQSGAATPFEWVIKSTLLLELQKYYEKSFAQGTAPVDNAEDVVDAVVAIQVGTVHVTFVYPYRALKRAVPTVTFYNPGAGTAGQAENFASSTACSVTGVLAASGSILSIQANCAGGSASVDLNGVHFAASADFW